MRNAVQNDFIFIFASDIIVWIFITLDSLTCNFASFFGITDIEENTSISKGFFISFGSWDSDFVDLNVVSKKRFDDSLNLFF